MIAQTVRTLVRCSDILFAQFAQYAISSELATSSDCTVAQTNHCLGLKQVVCAIVRVGTAPLHLHNCAKSRLDNCANKLSEHLTKVLTDCAIAQLCNHMLLTITNCANKLSEHLTKVLTDCAIAQLCNHMLSWKCLQKTCLLVLTRRQDM